MRRCRRGNVLRLCLALLGMSAVHPVCAQISLVGYWEPVYHEDYVERIPGPAIGDYAGLPINDAARLRADSWDASLLTVPERQCMPHPSTYGFRGVGTLRIWETRDPETQQLVKIDTWITWQSQHREIWMDGRPPPPANALHTWQGFSRGRWEGNVLVVETDRLKAGWVRRNGLPLTDRATMKEYFFRHGDVLTHVAIVSDPVYLTEPLVRSNGFRHALNGAMIPYPCRPATEIARPKGEVPHHLPGQNRFLDEYAIAHGVPVEAARGGAHTALPEYMEYMEMAPAHRPEPPARTPVASHPARTQPKPAGEVSVLPVRGGVYLAAGAGNNAVVQVGNQGVLVVDTGLAAAADELLAAIGDLAGDRTIRYIVGSSGDPDNVGGNEKLREAGATIMGGNVVMDDPRGQRGATVITHENVLGRMAGFAAGSRPVPEELWPTETFAEDAYDLFFNDEAVRLIHPPAAHTDGDVLVFFRKSDVLATGDIFMTTTYPVVDLEHGGSINGLIAALNRIIDITVPRDKQEGGTIVVPGRGRLCDEADVVEYRDMVTIIRDRIQDMIAAGMTLEQVQAAKPTRDYDGRFDANGAAEKFVDSVYRSLKSGWEREQLSAAQ